MGTSTSKPTSEKSGSFINKKNINKIEESDSEIIEKREISSINNIQYKATPELCKLFINDATYNPFINKKCPDLMPSFELCKSYFYAETNDMNNTYVKSIHRENYLMGTSEKFSTRIILKKKKKIIIMMKIKMISNMKMKI